MTELCTYFIAMFFHIFSYFVLLVYIGRKPGDLILSEADMIAHASGKCEVLDRLLVKLKAKGHRAVIFSQFTRHLDIIDDLLRMRGYKFCRLDGSTFLHTHKMICCVLLHSFLFFSRFLLLLCCVPQLLAPLGDSDDQRLLSHRAEIYSPLRKRYSRTVQSKARLFFL